MAHLRGGDPVGAGDASSRRGDVRGCVTSRSGSEKEMLLACFFGGQVCCFTEQPSYYDSQVLLRARNHDRVSNRKWRGVSHSFLDEILLVPCLVLADILTCLYSFITGFNANLRLWQSAADLLLEIRLIQDKRAAEQRANVSGQMPVPVAPVLSAEDRMRLDALHVCFATSLDDLPSHLLPDSLRPFEGGNATSPGEHPSRNQFILQIANLQVSYHCLRMVAIQKLEGVGYFTPAEHGAEVLLLHKTEIARDMLRIIREAPFWSLQVNGEPSVSFFFSRLLSPHLLPSPRLNER